MGRTRHRVRPAGTYFVTIDCWARRQLLKGEVGEIVTDQLLQCRRKGYFLLHEFCILPNHAHVLLTPAGDTTLEKAVQMIKGGASHRIGKARRFHTIRQGGYHDWRCRDEKDYQSYAKYIRENPVKAGLVNKAEEWPNASSNPKFGAVLDEIPQGLEAKGKDKTPKSALKG